MRLSLTWLLVKRRARNGICQTRRRSTPLKKSYQKQQKIHFDMAVKVLLAF